MKISIPKKIPTLVGIILVGIIVAGTSVGYDFMVQNKSSAKGGVEPRNVRITNINDNGFAVTWLTDEEATGLVNINSISINNSYFDERDIRGKMDKYQTHSVIVKGMDSGKSYSFKILSDGKSYDNNGEGYKVSTAPKINSEILPLEPAYGSSVTPDNKPAKNAIVYLNIEGSQTLSTLIKPGGSWIIPLNQIRTGDLSGYINPSERMTENITILHPIDISEATTDTLNDSPVPMMVIGKSYDFRKQQAKIQVPEKSLGSLKPPVQPENNILGSQSEITTLTNNTEISIIQPADKSTLISDLPLFKGKAFPGNEVLLSIGIKNPVTSQVRTTNEGFWQYTPDKPLGSGKQSITITTQDKNSKSVAVTHTFEILKSGTQVLGDATPSASLTPQPTIEPTLEPTVQPTIQPTLEPTVEPTPDLTGATPPQSGNTTPVLILIIGSLLLLGSGIVLHFSY